MTLQTVTANGAAHGIERAVDSRVRKLGGIAIVGLGYWGPNWIRNLYPLQCADRLAAAISAASASSISKAFIPRWRCPRSSIRS